MKWSAPTLGIDRKPNRILSLPTALRLDSVMSNTPVALLTTPPVITTTPAALPTRLKASSSPLWHHEGRGKERLAWEAGRKGGEGGIRGLDCECGRHLDAADPESLFESTWTRTTRRMSSATSRSAA